MALARWLRPLAAQLRRVSNQHKVRRPTAGIRVEGLEERCAPAVFTVTNTGDNGGVNPAPLAGTGTLRQAIVDANAMAGKDTIAFNIPGGGVHTIRPDSELPWFTDEVVIDGYTQPGSKQNTLAVGSDATLTIELDGSNLPDFTYGLVITGGNSVVRGLVLHQFYYEQIIVANKGGNAIEGCFIGTDPTGTQPAAPRPDRPGVGVVVYQCDGNRVGTNGDGVEDPAERNIISGNTSSAGWVVGSNNRVAGNYIGTDATGTVAIPNGGGVAVSSGSGNIIGTDGSDDGFNAIERNIISGNNGTAISIAGSPDVIDTWIAGNYIGLNATGDAALPNYADGINSGTNATTRIGTNADGVHDDAERNVISGNILSGTVSPPGAIGAGIFGGGVIAGNYIGTDATGTKAIGNVVGIFNNRGLIGTNGDGVNDAAEQNVISGNNAFGIVYYLSNGGTVAGNYIGTDATGTGGLGNGIGIRVLGSTNVRIGTDGSGDGYDAHERNVIAANVNAGIEVRSSANNVTVAGNYIGTDKTGMLSLPNGGGGDVAIFEGAHDNLIGTDADGVADDLERNVMAGGVGITAFGGSTGTGNVVAGNYVGLLADGLTLSGTGVVITDRSGTRLEGNVLSAVRISGPLATGNQVMNNFIGTDATGTTPLGVWWVGAGVQIIEGASENLVEGNVIGGYTTHGVLVDRGHDNHIIDNWIGTNPAKEDLGNAKDGVQLSWGAQGNEVTGNTVANNGGAGVVVGHLPGNRISGNSIHDNGGLGIDILVGGTVYGVTPNDAGDADVGANNFQNFPVLNAPPGSNLTGTLNSTPDSTFRIEFFANTQADPSGYGEGERYLGFIDVTTDAAGDVAFTAPSFSLLAGETYLTTTATNLATGDTSEFSNAVPVNAAPTAHAGGPYVVMEGNSVTLDASSSSDPDNDPLTYIWDVNGDGVFGDATGVNPTLAWSELVGLGINDGQNPDSLSTFNVRVRVSDGINPAVASDPSTLTVQNAPPVVGAIAGPSAPVPVNASASLSASFTDAGGGDTHTAVWNWGDNSTSPGTVSETNGSGSVIDSHAYSAAGVYTVTLTVTDKDGGSGSTTFQYVVVYDPSAGFVTGGGWINSPAGAYAADPSLSGKATFGFVSQYHNGATVPTGDTQFQFNVGNFKFKSTSYDWLVISGAKARYRGTGTVNGNAGYGFELTAIDGQVSGGGGVDKFRIRIWDKATGAVLYDNQVTGDTSDGADPTTALGGGSIVIHK